MMNKQLDLILDVESSDLFGYPIAVGAVVMDGDLVVDAMVARVLIGPVDIGQEFLQFYKKHLGCRVWSDVNFPVETNFLFQVFRNYPDVSPYPLLDIAHDLHPDVDRLEYCGLTHFPAPKFPTWDLSGPLIKHNPLHDAYVSWMAYRKFIANLKLLS